MEPPLKDISNAGEDEKKSARSDAGSKKSTPAGSRAGSAKSNRLKLQGKSGGFETILILQNLC